MMKHVDYYDDINVTKSERLHTNSSLKGNQPKWLHENMFIKLNNGKCYEDISEVLVSYFLQFTSIKNFVKYKCCRVIEDGVILGNGCYSYNFLQDDEKDVTFYKLFKQYGLDISNADYDFVRDNILNITGIEFKPYIDECLCLDAIVANEDRHFNNLSVIRGRDGFKFAPIYDNGLSCLSDVYSYPLSVDVKYNLSKIFAKPFKFSFEEQLKSANATPILVDINGFLSSVKFKTDIELRALEVIKLGLEKYRGFAWEKY